MRTQKDMRVGNREKYKWYRRDTIEAAKGCKRKAESEKGKTFIEFKPRIL